MLVPLVGLLVGVLAGFVLNVNVGFELQRYSAVAILAGSALVGSGLGTVDVLLVMSGKTMWSLVNSMIAFAVNERQENIGARRLYTVMERLLDDVSYTASKRTGLTCDTRISESVITTSERSAAASATFCSAVRSSARMLVGITTSAGVAARAIRGRVRTTAAARGKSAPARPRTSLCDIAPKTSTNGGPLRTCAARARAPAGL